MLAPTPLIAPSPMDIGDLFSATLGTLKRRFGLFVLLAFLPALVTTVLVAAAVLLIGLSFVSVPTTGSPSTGLLVAGIVIMIVGVILGALTQVKAYGLMSLAAYEIAQGNRPTVRGLLQTSRGLLPRMASVIAIMFGIVIVYYGLIAAILVTTVGGAAARGVEHAGAAIAAAVGLIALISLGTVVVALFFSVKLLYTLPSVAIEARGGIDGLKRSWSLTRGSFWRTLGYYLVAAIAIVALTSLFSALGQLMVPRGDDLTSISDGSSPAAILARLGVLIPLVLLNIGLQFVVSVLTVPFLQTYVTYMFIDQVRRSELPPAAPYGFTPAPGFGTPPAGQPPYPPAPQQYPQQGWTPPQPPNGPGVRPPRCARATSCASPAPAPRRGPGSPRSRSPRAAGAPRSGCTAGRTPPR